jgi:hypothetical protein
MMETASVGGLLLFYAFDLSNDVGLWHIASFHGDATIRLLLA